MDVERLWYSWGTYDFGMIVVYNQVDFNFSVKEILNWPIFIKHILVKRLKVHEIKCQILKHFIIYYFPTTIN